jgi:hypothetical protein
MSAMGHKQKRLGLTGMSVLPSRGDVVSQIVDIRKVPDSDIVALNSLVRDITADSDFRLIGIEKCIRN